MVSLVLKSFWLIEAGPHRGRVHFITPLHYDPLLKYMTIEKLLDTNAQMIRVCVLYNCRVRVALHKKSSLGGIFMDNMGLYGLENRLK